MFCQKEELYIALAEIICTICQDELATEHTAEHTLPNLLAKVREIAYQIGIDPLIDITANLLGQRHRNRYQRS